MSGAPRTIQDARKVFNTNWNPNYDDSAPSYEKDLSLMEYMAHHHTVNVLAPHFTGTPSAAQVLDVACGSGLVGKVMSQLGFRLFVGVDASEGMLKEAQQTGLYQRLQLAVVGKHPLPVDAGGLVSLGRGNYPRPEYISYDEELARELQQMERKGSVGPA